MKVMKTLVFNEKTPVLLLRRGTGKGELIGVPEIVFIKFVLKYSFKSILDKKVLNYRSRTRKKDSHGES